jgi:hypothetical protein
MPRVKKTYTKDELLNILQTLQKELKDKMMVIPMSEKDLYFSLGKQFVYDNAAANLEKGTSMAEIKSDLAHMEDDSRKRLETIDEKETVFDYFTGKAFAAMTTRCFIQRIRVEE